MTAPEVDVKVNIVPAKRRATFKVPINAEGGGTYRAIATVGAKEVRVVIEPYGGQYLPATIEAADALIALVQAVRNELIEQGVTPAK